MNVNVKSRDEILFDFENQLQKASSYIAKVIKTDLENYQNTVKEPSEFEITHTIPYSAIKEKIGLDLGASDSLAIVLGELTISKISEDNRVENIYIDELDVDWDYGEFKITSSFTQEQEMELNQNSREGIDMQM